MFCEIKGKYEKNVFIRWDGTVLASLFVEPETDAEVCAKGNGIVVH